MARPTDACSHEFHQLLGLVVRLPVYDAIAALGDGINIEVGLGHRRVLDHRTA
jgi:hypothetical protein